MSLLDQTREEFCFMEKTRVADSEGGFVTTWAEGAHFMASLAHDTTIEAQIAEQENTASTYSFFVAQTVDLDYHDAVKRLSDNQIFRITQPSMEDKTPAMSRLNLTKVTAEKWSLPA